MKSINNKNHPGRMLAGISTLNKNTTQTPDKSLPGWHKAFTLLELLVVILIIGILAAIALPQYQKAVLRSRYATVKSLVHSIANAERVYYIANGTYGPFDELDVEIGGTEISSVQHSFPWGYCYVEGVLDEWDPKVYCMVNHQGGAIRYQENIRTSQRACTAIGSSDTTDLLHRLCQSETNRSSPSSCLEGTYCVYYY